MTQNIDAHNLLRRQERDSSAIQPDSATRVPPPHPVCRAAQVPRFLQGGETGGGPQAHDARAGRSAEGTLAPHVRAHRAIPEVGREG